MRSTRNGRRHAHQAGEDEGDEIAVERGPDDARSERRGGSADLMGRHDPAEHDGAFLAAEDVVRQAHGRRQSGHPVETVEDRKDREPDRS